MTKVIKFPKPTTNQQAHAAPRPAPKAATAPKKSKIGGFFNAVHRVIWLFTLLLWPLLKWVIAMDCVWQFVRMIYYWDTPNMNAGWTFLLHYSVLCILTYYVSAYEPKGMNFKK